MEINEKTTMATVTVERFTKNDLIKSKHFEARCDLLVALLDEGKTYTIAETETVIADYMKKEVR